jgi:hypothetical protein
MAGPAFPRGGLGAQGRARRRAHDSPWSTARDSRRPYAGPPCGRHAVARLGAGALAPERGEDAVVAIFYFICAT